MILTLVRHGEVEPRYHGCYNGHIDIGLSPRGERAACGLAERFKDARFDAVYCSDLRRARQTLAPFALTVQPYYTEILREKSWGRHEGMGFEAICEKEDLAYESFGQWLDALDGEPYGEYAERIRRFFFDELPRQKHRHVLVMTHAGVIRTLYGAVCGLPLEAAFSWKLPYGAYVTYDYASNSFGEVTCAC